MSRLAVIMIACLTVWFGTAAFACYSGLVVIPTADVISSGECCIELQYDGVFATDSTDSRILNTQFGVMPRLEAGFDFDLSDDPDSLMLGHAKYLVSPADGCTPAMAVGICNVGQNIRSSSYALITHQFQPLRGHLGIMRIDGNNRWFIGADQAVNNRLILMADYTSGDENCSSVGFSYQKTDRFGILAGVLFPNDSKEDTGFSVHLVFSGV